MTDGDDLQIIDFGPWNIFAQELSEAHGCLTAAAEILENNGYEDVEMSSVERENLSELTDTVEVIALGILDALTLYGRPHYER